MPVVRAAVLLLLLAAGISFALFAFTGNAKYKRAGLMILKWTLLAVFAFFVVLALERIFE
jgi:hypothetical protein